jgi:ATP-dependent Lon protease
MSMQAQSRFLPLFPLQVVVFPGEPLHLHIFEPRYRQLIGRAVDEGITFGIFTSHKGVVQPLGTEVKLLEVVKTYADGRMDIRLEGLEIIRLLEFFPTAEGYLYPAGIVSSVPSLVPDLETPAPEAIEQKLRNLIEELISTAGVTKNFLPSVQGNLSYKVAHYLGLSVEEEYRMLEMPSEHARQVFLIEALKQVIPNLQRRKEVRKRVTLNGHFRELQPPTF